MAVGREPGHPRDRRARGVPDRDVLGVERHAPDADVSDLDPDRRSEALLEGGGQPALGNLDRERLDRLRP
jgi:hypothetical protein